MRVKSVNGHHVGVIALTRPLPYRNQVSFGNGTNHWTDDGEIPEYAIARQYTKNAFRDPHACDHDTDRYLS